LTTAEDGEDQDAVIVDSLDNMYNETNRAYVTLAKLSGMETMSQVLETFITMCINNLMNQGQSESRSDSRTIDISLEVINLYLHNSIACRKIAEL
jgi:hypothetical protein